MSAVGKIALNYKNNKHSHITLFDPAEPYSASTNVTAVFDTANELSWTPKKVKLRGKHTLIIRLKGKGLHSHAVAAKKGRTKKPSVGPDDPTTGTVTITITNPDQTVTVPDVTYIDDDES